MGELRVQVLSSDAEVALAAVDAESWGFPREVESVELDQADWFRLGESVVFWFEHYAVSPTYFVHVAAAPESRGRWPWRRWLRWIEHYARAQGAPEIGYVPHGDGARVGRALRALGWRVTAYGLCRPLVAEAA